MNKPKPQPSLSTWIKMVATLYTINSKTVSSGRISILTLNTNDFFNIIAIFIMVVGCIVIMAQFLDIDYIMRNLFSVSTDPVHSRMWVNCRTLCDHLRDHLLIYLKVKVKVFHPSRPRLIVHKDKTSVLVRSTNSKFCNPVGKFEEKLAYTMFH